MKGVARPTATSKLTRYLTKRQGKANADSIAGTLDIEASWKAARRTLAVTSGLTLLQNVMGPTERCMYCVDSHGTDIDHYWPKVPYTTRAFDWHNMVLCCTPCGRIKGNRFPLHPITGTPLLVNPLNDNPWEFLSFDPSTGNMSARFDPVSMCHCPRGEATVEVLRLDRREAVATGYKRTILRLDSFLGSNLPKLASGVMSASSLVQELRAIDDHYLLEWCLSQEGSTYSNFRLLNTNLPLVWNDCLLAL